MDKQNLAFWVYLYNGILFSHQKEGNTATTWMHLENFMLNERGQAVKATCMIPFL